jgi:PAS domain S-box-containing protein/putative nucleotidyltransferase with HDIG domain
MGKNSKKNDLLLKEIKSLDSKEFFQTLFEYAPDPYYITDLEGNFIDGNKAAERITGYQKEELVGKNFFQLNILPSSEIPKAQQALTKNQQGLSTGPDEFSLYRKDYKNIAVEIFTYPLKIKDKHLVLAIARDITKRKRTEKDLSERNKELNCLYSIFKILENPKISIDQALQSIVELLPSAWQYPEFVCASIQMNSQNFKTDNFQETKWKQSAPINVNGRPAGELEVCYLKSVSQPAEDPFLKEEYNLINSLVKRISQFLERKEAEEKIKQLNSLLKSIRNVNQLIVQEHDFNKVIQESCRILQQTRDYLNIEIALLDGKTGKIKPVAKEGVRHLKDWEAKVDNPADAPRCIQEVIQSREPNMIIQASREYCGSCPYYMADLEVPYKNIFVPMLLKGRLVGIITATVRTEHKITPEEIDLLKEVAADLAFARDNSLAEEKILAHFRLLQIAGKTAKFGGWSVDPATQTCLWSDTVADIHEMPHGYAPHVKEGIKFYAPEWRERITEVFSKCAHQGKPYDEEMEIITGKGKRKWVRTTGRAVKNKKGEIVQVIGSFQDITKHKKTEQELREEKALLTTVMDNLPIGIAINKVFPSVDFVYMNKKFPQIYRTTRKKLSKPGVFWDVVYKDPVFRNQIKKRVEDAIASGEPSRMYWENIPLTCKREETRYISAYNIPIPGKDLVISTVMDVMDINRSQQKLSKTMNATIETISKISETRDPYTAGHQYRVYQLSMTIARELRLSREKIEAVRIAALIHDIGKMAIPSEILTKPGKLSEIEFDLIKEHPKTGYEILKDIDFPYPIAQIVRQHHERINGSGYPQGLKEEDVLLEAKIIGVADVVEAMSSHRPYRASLGIDTALDEITKNKGILYDPEIVDICVRLFRKKGFKFE